MGHRIPKRPPGRAGRGAGPPCARPGGRVRSGWNRPVRPRLRRVRCASHRWGGGAGGGVHDRGWYGAHSASSRAPVRRRCGISSPVCPGDRGPSPPPAWDLRDCPRRSSRDGPAGCCVCCARTVSILPSERLWTRSIMRDRCFATACGSHSNITVCRKMIAHAGGGWTSPGRRPFRGSPLTHRSMHVPPDESFTTCSSVCATESISTRPETC